MTGELVRSPGTRTPNGTVGRVITGVRHERGDGLAAVADDVFRGQALGGGLGQQRLQPGGPVLGPVRARRPAAGVTLHHRAGLAAEPQQAFLAEQVVALVHGVEVDAQVDRELPGGGQAGTGRLPAAGDRLDDPVPDLLVDGHRAVRLDAEQHVVRPAAE
jgi:hypothetical protein